MQHNQKHDVGFGLNFEIEKIQIDNQWVICCLRINLPFKNVEALIGWSEK